MVVVVTVVVVVIVVVVIEVDVSVALEGMSVNLFSYVFSLTNLYSSGLIYNSCLKIFMKYRNRGRQREIVRSDC